MGQSESMVDAVVAAVELAAGAGVQREFAAWSAVALGTEAGDCRLANDFSVFMNVGA